MLGLPGYPEIAEGDPSPGLGCKVWLDGLGVSLRMTNGTQHEYFQASSASALVLWRREAHPRSAAAEPGESPRVLLVTLEDRDEAPGTATSRRGALTAGRGVLTLADASHEP